MGYTEHVRLLAHQRLHPCVLTQEAGARREGGAAGGWDSGAHAYTHKHTHTHLLIAKRARDFKGLGKVVDRVLIGVCVVCVWCVCVCVCVCLRFNGLGKVVDRVLTVGDKFSVDTEIKHVTIVLVSVNIQHRNKICVGYLLIPGQNKSVGDIY